MDTFRKPSARSNASSFGTTVWADKAAFEAFGVLYYPILEDATQLGRVAVDDFDMAWACTCAANFEGTSYALDDGSLRTLAAMHHVTQAFRIRAESIGFAGDLVASINIDPAADIRALVPTITAKPMYPDFPSQVMQMSEAQFRYDQARHYASTYGVELVAGVLGLDVQVGRGWLPDVADTPKTEQDLELVPPRILRVVVTRSDMLALIAKRMATPTRMHPAELDVAQRLLKGVDPKDYPRVAFHENMMEMIRLAAHGSSAQLADMVAGLAQHPGDVMKAIMFCMETDGVTHLKTCQKKGFCRALEAWEPYLIARNAADASEKVRRALDRLSIARFGGPNLTEGMRLVESGEVRSWASEVERLWDRVIGKELIHLDHLKDKLGEYGLAKLLEHEGKTIDEAYAAARAQAPDAGDFGPLLAKYSERPGVLFRSITRLVKGGCPIDQLQDALLNVATSLSLPTVVRTLALMSATDLHAQVNWEGESSVSKAERARMEQQRQIYTKVADVLLELAEKKLRSIETPLQGKRVFVDSCGLSLRGSVLMPNDNGQTGTAWPPVGFAYDLPPKGHLRFFTFWDDREKRVDVDLHFLAITNHESLHIGWNSSYENAGMVTSGDITHSENAVEYLDIDMGQALADGVQTVTQHAHIFSGAKNWGDIKTCYGGATLVGSVDERTVLYDDRNILFRFDMTGEGREMDTALINVPEHYVRILRGAKMPFTDTLFTLGDYIDLLLEAQGSAKVEDPEEADVVLTLDRSADKGAISLPDENFFLGC